MPQKKDDHAAPPIAQAVLTDKESDEAEPNYFVRNKDTFPWSDNQDCPDIPNAEGTDGWSPAHTHKGEQPNVNWGAQT